MNTGTAKPVTLPVMENQLQLDHNHTTCHVYTNFSEFSPRASRRSHHPCLMIPAAWWEKDVDKAEILNAFFVRQASQSALDGEPPPVDAAPITEDSQLLVSFTISLSDVERALRTLNARKAPGFDGIPTRLLVILKDEIVHCVHHIFTLSLTSGTLPTD